MKETLENILKDIALLKDSKTVLKVNKGWSKDEKYYIVDKVGNQYLLRLSDIKNYEVKQKEFLMMKEVYELGVNMSVPVDYGVCNNGKNVYLLLTWIEGTALDEVISKMSKDEQYSLGVQAGRILKRFHSVSAPVEIEDWEQRMLKKFNHRLEKYSSCGFKVKSDDRAIEYVNRNLHLLKDRPQTFQHGDFHPGNLILTSEKEIGVIDFNRWDYGDPYEDFYKMMFFSRELSIPFSKGQIHGYFANDIPDDFFPILALYLADVILFSVVWAIPFGSDDIKGMVQRAEMILSDYSSFASVIPNWFEEQ